MIVSRLAVEPGPASVAYLPHRAVSVTVQTDEGPLHVIGIYVPSRDATQTKTTRERTFLEGLRTGVHLPVRNRPACTYAPGRSASDPVMNAQASTSWRRGLRRVAP